MPYKSEQIKIEHTEFDKRRKLSLKQHGAIKLLHTQGYSYSDLAEMFGCSKSNIQNIIRPFTRKPQNKSREYWTEHKRKYRQRKQQLYVEGKLNKYK